MRMPELFGAGEVRILRLEAATGLLALACVLLACMLLWQRLSGLPVCYGAAQVAPGLVIPNEVPDAFVKALSEQIALVLYNVTPETAEAAHERVAQLFHPQLLGIFQARSERERVMLREHNLSTQLSIRNTVVDGSGPATAPASTPCGGCSRGRCPSATRSLASRCASSACSRDPSTPGAWR